MWKSISTFLNKPLSQIPLSLPKPFCEHLALEDWNTLIEMLNFTTCYDVFEDGVSGMRLIFKPNGEEMTFFKSYKSHFAQKQEPYRKEIYHIIDTVIETLPKESKKILLGFYVNKEHKNWDLATIFNSLMFSKRHELMSSLLEDVMIYDNIRLVEKSNQKIRFFVDCREYKNFSVVVYPSLYPTWYYSPSGYNVNLSTEVFSSCPMLQQKYPGINFEMFEKHTANFAQNFVSKPIIKKYLSETEYKLSATFDNSKKIPEDFNLNALF